MKDKAERLLSDYYETAIQPYCTSSVEKMFDFAITAIKRNEAIREYCKTEIAKEGESDYVAGLYDACDNILEILEGEQ
jgi:hypothetical protein